EMAARVVQAGGRLPGETRPPAAVDEECDVGVARKRRRRQAATTQLEADVRRLAKVVGGGEGQRGLLQGVTPALVESPTLTAFFDAFLPAQGHWNLEKPVQTGLGELFGGVMQMVGDGVGGAEVERGRVAVTADGQRRLELFDHAFGVKGIAKGVDGGDVAGEL